ncbi:MAG: glucokinase, partial [Polyangiaceae bacterium]|nr:glucokinase [Polyangiaceae bacterium]
MILAGDVGGTNLRLALFERDGQGLVKVGAARYATASFERLEEAVETFCATGEVPVEAAGFGVAAPIQGTSARLTNSPLVIEAEAISATLGGTPVRLLNDLEATALGLAHLPASSFASLLPGAPDASGHRAVIAAGTGLGQSLLIWDGSRHIAVATEGGHVEFAPRTPLEVALLEALWAAGDAHVSYEAILSGSGFQAIYSFLAARGEHPRAPGCEPLAEPDPNRAITDAGVAGACPLCGATLALFCSVYGAEAGNLALKSMARGGVVL